MVEINNQRKGVPRYAGVVGVELITDVRKPEIMVMTSLWRESYLLITPITLANLSRQTQTQINRRRTLPASFPLVGCLPQRVYLKDFSPKSQDAVALQQIKGAWRFTYD